MGAVREMPLSSPLEIQFLERYLRQVYNTAPGVQCQALLTTEYLMWKHTLRQTWSSMTGAQPEKDHVLEAYIPGIRLAYSAKTCRVHEIRSTVVTCRKIEMHCTTVRKRKI